MVNINGKNYRMEISGTNEKPIGKVETYKSNDTIQQNAILFLNENDLTIQFNSNDDNFYGSIGINLTR